jgi:hypothetical protein
MRRKDHFGGNLHYRIPGINGGAALKSLSEEIDKVPYSRRYWIFTIIFVAELMFTLLEDRADFLGPLGITLSIFTLSYLGSLIVDREKRFKAIYSIAFTLYILLMIGRHKVLR